MNTAHIFGRVSRLDLGTALLAAFSACFVAYAAPDWRLGQVIGALSLDSLVPAFQPPLGNKIRILFMIAGAGAAFSGVLALMHFLDRLPQPGRRRAAAAAEDAPGPIRLRRVDFHPDAGVRRPLQPGRDIGEPQEAAEEPVAEPAVEPAPEPVAETEPGKPRVFGSKVVPEPEPEPLEPAVVAAPEVEPEPLELTVQEEAAFTPEPEAPAPAPQPFAIAPEPEQDEDQSLTKLMRRLERGVHKREQALPQPAAEAAPAPPPAEEPAGHRLRSAISDLQKLAARGA